MHLLWAVHRAALPADGVRRGLGLVVAALRERRHLPPGRHGPGPLPVRVPPGLRRPGLLRAAEAVPRPALRPPRRLRRGPRGLTRRVQVPVPPLVERYVGSLGYFWYGNPESELAPFMNGWLLSQPPPFLCLIDFSCSTT